MNRVKLAGMAAWLLLAALLAAIGVTRYLNGAVSPVVQVIGCKDIVRGCNGDGLRVRMDRAPEIMRPFKLEVEAERADTIEASFQMAGMEMGFNRYRLQRQDGDVWQAEVTLPICVRGRKDWLLLLEVHEGQAEKQVAVPFSTR